MTNYEYKQWLISEILNRPTNKCTYEELENYRVSTLEMLFDNVD